jgi:Transcription factor WhiB
MEHLRPDLSLAVTPEEYDARNCNGVDPNVFFPNKDTRELQRDAIKAAQLICADCEIQPQCLEVAMWDREKIGVWGGVYFGIGLNKSRNRKARLYPDDT